MNRVTVMVRYRRGVVGESRRTVHLVVLPASLADVPDNLGAVCGARFGPGDAETVNSPQGMPCVQCLAMAPVR
ncbi:hypothetical protein GCM10009676_33510 [Prauserella halophila]|uniref:Uncharacterized protein n=1 Tax=Prauserella halophila TaxID=185641 RepID=A0ABN1WC32_9PSEU|nr:hypothetical protein [Prauserella halophila]MCP2238473.1 hypothetical protein [Prauserella halophila]